jgi:hypothetical protein
VPKSALEECRRPVGNVGGRMGLIVITLVALVLLGAGIYYGYQAGYYDVRCFGGGLFVIVVVLLTFFAVASTS